MSNEDLKAQLEQLRESFLSAAFSFSALPLKADTVQHGRDVRFVPKADIA